VPLPAGAGDEALLAAYDEVILPALERFHPDLLLASAGFDAHAADPLASLEVSERGFARLAHRLGALAGGRVVYALEGGYDLRALGRSVSAVLAVMLGEPAPEPTGDEREALAGAERAAIASARRSLDELPAPTP
jgi:acetoin utilization deacetylase AcuC-like enzyme